MLTRDELQGPTFQERPNTVVDTACPLDCPDSCSLAVTVSKGRVVDDRRLDAEHADRRLHLREGQEVRRSRVRRCAAAISGRAHRHQRARPFLARRAGTKRSSSSPPACSRCARHWGGEAILPFSYGGSNGLLTQDTLDAVLFRRFGTSRLARTVCAAPTGVAAQSLYGKMPSVTYEDYPEAQARSFSGASTPRRRASISCLTCARRRNAARGSSSSTRARRRSRGRPICIWRRGPAPMSPSRSRSIAICSKKDSPTRAFLARAHERRRSAARAGGGVDVRARGETSRGAAKRRCERLARRLREHVAGADSLRLGPRAQSQRRQRGDVDSRAARGRRKIRRAGRRLLDEQLGGVEHHAPWLGPEPTTRIVNMNKLGRALLEYDDPPIKALFVYNCNPVATMPDQQRVLQGMAREDLFTVVFDQVMTDTAAFADVILPATTFLEAYDFARGYGPLSLQLVRPVIDAVGESRSNPEVFGELARRLELLERGEPDNELEMLLQLFKTLPGAVGAQISKKQAARRRRSVSARFNSST